MDSAALDELVIRSQNGDPVALSRLLKSCEPAMKRLALRVCPAAEAEDAVQEVLFRVSSKVGTLRVSAAFIGWSMKMVLRECLRLQRKVSRYVFTEVEQVSLPVPSSSEMVEALAAISEKSRSILLHRELLGRSAIETAEVLGITVESAKSRLRRARAELRAVFDESGADRLH